MLAVPMIAGNDVSGVIVLSSLGYGKFDEDDRRLLEVLASHAAVAVENAKLFQAEREAAETSAALLRLSQALTGMHTAEAILHEAMETIPSLVPSSAVSAYLRDDDTGAFLLRGSMLIDPSLGRIAEVSVIPAEVAQRFLTSTTDPFVLRREVVAEVPDEYRALPDPTEVLVAPLRWEPDGFGALVLIAPDTTASFGDHDVRLAGGIADIASLALGNANRLSELERFHELVESLDAVFWEARADPLTFTFLSRRADDLFGIDGDAWVTADRAWGEHILDEDRAAAQRSIHDLDVDAAHGTVEYRVQTPDGRTAWIRDLVHAVRGAQGGVESYRGLMVDTTERKRAEEALRKSERKYSEAFRREREAAQRLRALDEMKNTFLEAVSHDLRTPLTSILGSALTLEQSKLQLAPEDALDLVGRIAANARKLERLLSDLLDLDRLQRGIITPQRRSTDLEALVRHCVAESEHEADRRISVDVEPVTVEIDSAKVERIVENLLSNAIRHTPATAPVWVRAREENGGVLLVVEDAGPGVAEELREAVFEPFRQAPGSASMHSPGVGVGLTLVRRFAELHGGRAWVEPRDGGGASFRVFLPAA
jgi:PAS domain S-box-containing protein